MVDVRSLSVKLALALLMISLPASAADDDDDDEGVALTAGWDGDVAFIKSSDGAFFMELGGRIHLDFRAYTADFAPPPTFLVRRARLQTEGSSTVFSSSRSRPISRTTRASYCATGS